MAEVVVTIKIMPESPDVDMAALSETAVRTIKENGAQGEVKSVEEPVAFGLKALNLTFLVDEDKGSTEELENKLSGLEHVNSVEVTDVRRAMG